MDVSNLKLKLINGSSLYHIKIQKKKKKKKFHQVSVSKKKKGRERETCLRRQRKNHGIIKSFRLVKL